MHNDRVAVEKALESVVLSWPLLSIATDEVEKLLEETRALAVRWAVDELFARGILTSRTKVPIPELITRAQERLGGEDVKYEGPIGVESSYAFSTNDNHIPPKGDLKSRVERLEEQFRSIETKGEPSLLEHSEPWRQGGFYRQPFPFTKPESLLVKYIADSVDHSPSSFDVVDGGPNWVKCHWEQVAWYVPTKQLIAERTES